MMIFISRQTKFETPESPPVTVKSFQRANSHNLYIFSGPLSLVSAVKNCPLFHVPGRNQNPVGIFFAKTGFDFKIGSTSG
jgi:hypothetical protein